MGSYLLGVRTDSYDLDTRLRAALEAHVFDGVPGPAPDNYSVRLDPDDGDGPTRSLRTLYVGSTAQRSSRSPGRILDALLAHLSSWALRDDPSLVEVHAAAAVGHGRAILMPVAFASHSPQVERRLARAGLSLLDAPAVHLDLDAAEVVVAEPALHLDPAPLAELRAQGRPAGEGKVIAPGRYPVAGWLLPGGHGQGTGMAPLRSSEALAQAAAAVRPHPDSQSGEMLAGLARILRSGAARPVSTAPDEVAEAVLDVMG